MELKSNIVTISGAGFPLKKQGQEFIPLRSGQPVSPSVKLSADKNISAKKAELRKAAQGFEAIFIRKFLSTMRSAMSENSMFGSGVTGDIYGDIVDNAVAVVMSRKSVFGLADELYRAMVKNLETNYDSEREQNPGELISKGLLPD